MTQVTEKILKLKKVILDQNSRYIINIMKNIKAETV